jgi:hypothetical protein
MGWTHPICDECWTKRNPGRMPCRGLLVDVEKCCYCGKETKSGIYIREDPTKVNYPSKDS